jgi:hypothetical protein
MKDISVPSGYIAKDVPLVRSGQENVDVHVIRLWNEFRASRMTLSRILTECRELKDGKNVDPDVRSAAASIHQQFQAP